MYKSLRRATCCLFVLAAAVVAAEEDSRIRDGHNLLGDSPQRGVIEPGNPVGPLAFNDLDGEAVHLSDVVEQGPAVFVFLSTQCPLAKRYTARLNRLHTQYEDRGVQLFAVFPNSDETTEGIQKYLGAVKFPFAAVRDVDGYLARRLGATMTPQVFVVDDKLLLRYRGAIDDNRYEPRVKKNHLRDALDAVLAGQAVAAPSVSAVGCSIHREATSAPGDVTYATHIARILQDNCQSCHRQGQVAPFALTNYEEARRWKTEIKEYTRSRLMPPWKAAPGCGDFKNDISLTAKEIDLIASWIDNGTPLGDRADLPPEPKFRDGWALGEPDLIVEMPAEYVIGPEGEDDYRHFIIPHELIGDRYVKALDVQPGNRGVVHHVIVYTDTSGKARKLDAADPGPGYTRFGDVGFRPASSLGGWAPGMYPTRTPAGSGRWLPKKCDIVMQVHYYRTGVEERDRTRVGVYFSKADKPVRAHVTMAINQRIRIPAKAKSHVERAVHTIKHDSYAYSVTPHMHLIGETMEVTAHLPDGGKIPLVQIDDWDFNWQTTYHFRKLHFLPAGTKVKLVATFDNSAENPNNPNDPPVEIRWGDKTTDEMCIAFVGLLKASEYDPEKGGRRTAGDVASAR